MLKFRVLKKSVSVVLLAAMTFGTISLARPPKAHAWVTSGLAGDIVGGVITGISVAWAGAFYYFGMDKHNDDEDKATINGQIALGVLGAIAGLVILKDDQFAGFGHLTKELIDGAQLTSEHIRSYNKERKRANAVVEQVLYARSNGATESESELVKQFGENGKRPLSPLTREALGRLCKYVQWKYQLN